MTTGYARCNAEVMRQCDVNELTSEASRFDVSSLAQVKCRQLQHLSKDGSLSYLSYAYKYVCVYDSMSSTIKINTNYFVGYHGTNGF